MLNSVEIKNFRSCRSTKIEFGTNVCALSGRNGVGKSNILKAIDWVCRSVIAAEPIRIRHEDSSIEDRDGIEIDFYLTLNSCIYHYHFQYHLNISNISKNSIPTQYKLPGLQESFGIPGEDVAEHNIFDRQGEAITVAGRKDPIRIPQWIPAPAALKSLLAVDDPQLVHIDRMISFFNRTRYYTLDDIPDENDLIPENAYNEWKYRYQTEGFLTGSSAMRLIYMHEQERELYDEFVHIVGPMGLGIIENINIPKIDLADFGGSKDKGSSGAKLFYLYIRPSKNMGGAGGDFPFSALSVGTRRVIQIIVSMLFDKRSLMLLEHPEDSIHPGLLRKLIDLLRTYSYESQTIFTTHSPEVLDILNPEEILLVTAPEGSTQARKLASEEILLAKDFLKNEGTLSEFLEPMDNL